jgi:hypothetical protein
MTFGSPTISTFRKLSGLDSVPSFGGRGDGEAGCKRVMSWSVWRFSLLRCVRPTHTPQSSGFLCLSR